MENLRIFLYPYSTNEPVYFGCKFKPHVRQVGFWNKSTLAFGNSQCFFVKGYMSGGAGYVLSRESLRRFAEEAYSNGTICRQTPGGSEDLEMGLCLQNVNVVAGDSRDRLKRGRFFPSTPTGHIIPKERHHWYWRYIYYDTKDVSYMSGSWFALNLGQCKWLQNFSILGGRLLFKLRHIISLHTTQLYVRNGLPDLPTEPVRIADQNSFTTETSQYHRVDRYLA